MLQCGSDNPGGMFKGGFLIANEASSMENLQFLSTTSLPLTLLKSWMTDEAGPLISIVTPTLNAADYIEAAIASVKNQTYPHIEHIIIDGQSSDNTVEILKRNEKTYRMKWISEKDSSPSEGGNKGLRIASGELFAILPADDIYLPWAVEAVVEQLKSAPEADLLYGDLVQAAFGRQFGNVFFAPPEDTLESQLEHASIAGMATFFRRRVFVKLAGFDEALHIGADYDFWLRAVKSFKFRRVPEVLALFRYREHSKSMENLELHALEKKLIRSRYLDPRDTGILPEARHAFRRYSYIISALKELFRESAKDSEPKRWNRFIQSGCVSRGRLLHEVMLSLAIYSLYNFDRRVRHGYVDVDKLISFSLQGK